MKIFICYLNLQCYKNIQVIIFFNGVTFACTCVKFILVGIQHFLLVLVKYAPFLWHVDDILSPFNRNPFELLKEER